jgi:hypothetical protein
MQEPWPLLQRMPTFLPYLLLPPFLLSFFLTSPQSVRRLSRKCGSLDVSQPSGPPRPVTRKALPYFREGTEENNEKPQGYRCPTEHLSNTNLFGLKFYRNSSVGLQSLLSNTRGHDNRRLAVKRGPQRACAVRLLSRSRTSEQQQVRPQTRHVQFLLSSVLNFFL